MTAETPSPGARLTAALAAELAEDGLEPDARDAALIDTAARLADRMAALESMIAEDGERSVSSTGIVRLHPAVAEYRNHSVALSKVLASIAMTDSAGGRKDPKKSKAAETRWRSHNAGKAS